MNHQMQFPRLNPSVVTTADLQGGLADDPHGDGGC
jgi:hypothetical protein